MDFIHLHVHSHYSLMDGLNTSTELAAAAKDLGQLGIASTDHGSLATHREAQRAAAELGMKPILGVEAYISPTDRFDKRSVKSRDDNTNLYNHIILLAKNQQGLNNLNKLSERAWTEGYYYKPRIDHELLYEYRDGLIVLSGCLNGLISKAIEREDLEEADRLTRWYKETFEDDFYMEVQSHNPIVTNQNLLALADKYNIKPVATSDCHYAKAEDKWVEEALLILSTSPKKNQDADYASGRAIRDIYERLNHLYPDRTMSFEDFKLYVQARGEMVDDFAKSEITRSDIFDNTMDVFNKIGSYEYKENLEVLPRPKRDPMVELREMAYAGLQQRIPNYGENYAKRLEMELGVIERLNFAPYFLIVADMVGHAKDEGIRVGPGRGSGAGSLLNYAIRITDIDPIKHGLLFARFINEERTDWPDIDVDIEGRRRNEIKDYMVSKFKNVASVSNYNYFADKSVVRDAARVYMVPLSEVNKALKTVETFEQFEDSSTTEDFRRKYPEVLDLARRLRGRIRSSSMHAGGLVVAKNPISTYAPIETRSSTDEGSDSRIPVVAADKKEIAKIGLIKIDALGIKTLSVIDDALELIKERHGIDIDPLDIPMDQDIIYRTLAAGFTKGVFQAEATPYTNLLIKMGCDNFNDLVASNALVRPGAMNTVGASYIARKQGREQVKTFHPLLDEITKETYGVIIYQEQVMLACVEIGGFSWSEADEIRSIIGKKENPHKFDAFKQRWMNGATKHITDEQAEQLWHDFEAHAGYSFNKSHAVAYSTLSYWTAWLKYYYKHEYMTALLRNENEARAVTGYMIEAKRLGIRVLLPHVNASGTTFELQDDAIRIGLGNIKYISENTAPIILKRAPYSSYAALRAYAAEEKNGMNSRMVQALDAVGAAVFDDNPATGQEVDNFYEYLKIPKFNTSMVPQEVLLSVQTTEDYDEEGTFLLLGVVEKIKRGKGWALIDFVDEAGQASVFASDTDPIEKGVMYLMLISANRITKFIPANEILDRQDPLIDYLMGTLTVPTNRYLILDFNPHMTKAKKQMAYVTLVNDELEMHRVMVFDDLFRKSLGAMAPGKTPALSLARLKSGALFVKEIYDEHKLRKPTRS